MPSSRKQLAPWVAHEAFDCGGVCRTKCLSCGKAASGKPGEFCKEVRHARLYQSAIVRKKETRHGQHRPKPKANWTTWRRTRCNDGSFQTARVCSSCGIRRDVTPPSTCAQPLHAATVLRNHELGRVREHKARRPFSIRKHCLNCGGVITQAPLRGCSEPKHSKYAATRSKSRVATRHESVPLPAPEPIIRRVEDPPVGVSRALAIFSSPQEPIRVPAPWSPRAAALLEARADLATPDLKDLPGSD